MSSVDSPEAHRAWYQPCLQVKKNEQMLLKRIRRTISWVFGQDNVYVSVGETQQLAVVENTKLVSSQKVFQRRLWMRNFWVASHCKYPCFNLVVSTMHGSFDRIVIITTIIDRIAATVQPSPLVIQYRRPQHDCHHCHRNNRHCRRGQGWTWLHTTQSPSPSPWSPIPVLPSS